MNARLAELESWYSALEPREQWIVRVAAVAGGTLLLATLLLQLHAALQRLDQRLAHKRADAAYIASVLPELRAVPMPQGAGQSLLLVVDRTTRDAGLAANLRGTEPSGAASVRVRFEGAAFEALITWVLRVEREYGLSVQSATFEKTDAPGRVNATLALVRP